MVPRIILTLFLTGYACLATAETVFIDATKDNTLYESPSGLYSNGMGNHIIVGETVDLLKRRAVIAFTKLDAIPAGSTITSVKLHLYLDQENSDATMVDLKRLTSNWGEGASDAQNGESNGANAQPGDATWVHTFFSLSQWGKPGGDFVVTPSDSQAIDNVGWHTFGSSNGMVQDVQGWLDSPNSNFGWVLIGDETVESERQFYSRNFSIPDVRPVLEVQYSKTGSPYDFSGPWFDPSLDGEGYLVYQTPAGWLVYYFGYGLDGGFLWLVSELVPLATLNFGEPFEVPMLVGKPGTFYVPGPSSDLSSYGTLSVSFETCTAGEFILDGTDGVKVSNVSKLIGVDNTDCQNLLQNP